MKTARCKPGLFFFFFRGFVISTRSSNLLLGFSARGRAALKGRRWWTKPAPGKNRPRAGFRGLSSADTGHRPRVILAGDHPRAAERRKNPGIHRPILISYDDVSVGFRYTLSPSIILPRIRRGCSILSATGILSCQDSVSNGRRLLLFGR
jgi:hypothetical protein